MHEFVSRDLFTKLCTVRTVCIFCSFSALSEVGGSWLLKLDMTQRKIGQFWVKPLKNTALHQLVPWPNSLQTIRTLWMHPIERGSHLCRTSGHMDKMDTVQDRALSFKSRATDLRCLSLSLDICASEPRCSMFTFTWQAATPAFVSLTSCSSPFNKRE